MVKMITIEEVYEKLKEKKAHEEVEFRDEIDISNCPYLLGYRCGHGIHVGEDKRHAHLDYVDPIEDPIGHLEKDVGIKKEVIYSAVGAAAGGIISALGDRDELTKNSVKAAIEGAIIGALIGMLAR